MALRLRRRHPRPGRGRIAWAELTKSEPYQTDRAIA